MELATEVPDRTDGGTRWLSYRRRRLFLFATLAVYLPGVWALEKSAEHLFGTEKWFPLVAGSLLLLTVISNARLALWRCPKCRKFFQPHLGVAIYQSLFALRPSSI